MSIGFSKMDLQCPIENALALCQSHGTMIPKTLGFCLQMLGAQRGGCVFEAALPTIFSLLEELQGSFYLEGGPESTFVTAKMGERKSRKIGNNG